MSKTRPTLRKRFACFSALTFLRQRKARSRLITLLLVVEIVIPALVMTTATKARAERRVTPPPTTSVPPEGFNLHDGPNLSASVAIREGSALTSKSTGLTTIHELMHVAFRSQVPFTGDDTDFAAAVANLAGVKVPTFGSGAEASRWWGDRLRQACGFLSNGLEGPGELTKHPLYAEH